MESLCHWSARIRTEHVQVGRKILQSGCTGTRPRIPIGGRFSPDRVFGVRVLTSTWRSYPSNPSIHDGQI
jgi:hypothetical protein